MSGKGADPRIGKPRWSVKTPLAHEVPLPSPITLPPTPHIITPATEQKGLPAMQTGSPLMCPLQSCSILISYGINPVCFQIQTFCACGISPEAPQKGEVWSLINHLPVAGRQTPISVSPSPS